MFIPLVAFREALVRVELTMADLQSAALATWLQRLILNRILPAKNRLHI